MDRRRGISFLRVSATEGQVPESSTPDTKNGAGGSPRGSPNQTLATSVSSLGITSPSAGNSSTNLGIRSPSGNEFSPPQRRSTLANGHASDISGSPNVSSGNPLAADVSRDSDALTKFLSQLAAKQARVVELKEEQSRIAADLQAAEADLQRFQEDGRHFASLVGTPRNVNTRNRSNSKGGESGDVLVMGKRVVDEIGSQFWSFVEDVRSATMGNFNPEDEDAPTADGRARQLRPRESLQNLAETIRRKSRSPASRARTPQSRSPRLDGQTRSQPQSPRLDGSTRLDSARPPSESGKRSPRLGASSPRLPSPTRDESHKPRDVSPPRLPQRPKFAEQLPPPSAP